MKLEPRKIPVVAMMAALVLAGCSRPDGAEPSQATFDAGLRHFLADGHDQLCLGMHDWPIDLTEAEAGAHSRHAVQLPVFEKLGLVRSAVVPVARSAENPDGAIKRYELTDDGHRYYQPHAVTSGDATAYRNDFCVAHISVAKVQSWQLDTHDAQNASATVSYTYHVEAAPWLQDAEAQQVLPMVARVLKGADGTSQLRQGFRRGPDGWVAVPGPV